MSWQNAYLEQAKSDYDIYNKLNTDKAKLCHRLHYLQMTSEKLAKSFLCHDSQPYKNVHYAFVRFLQTSTHHPKIPRLFGMNRKAYRAYINTLLNFAKKVEDLAPIGGNNSKENPEYPWKDKFGNIQIPDRYSFPGFSITDIAKTQTLLTSLFKIAKSI